MNYIFRLQLVDGKADGSIGGPGPEVNAKTQSVEEDSFHALSEGEVAADGLGNSIRLFLFYSSCLTLLSLYRNCLIYHLSSH